MNDVVYVLVGTVLGAAISAAALIFREWLCNRNNLKLELVRLYGRDRLEAYKKLLTFAWRITETCYPLADNKSSAFIRIMETDFAKYVKPAYLYYDEDTIKMLDEFDNMYFSLTEGRADIPEEGEEELKRFLEGDLFDLASKLKELARKEAALAKMI